MLLLRGVFLRDHDFSLSVSAQERRDPLRPRAQVSTRCRLYLLALAGSALRLDLCHPQIKGPATSWHYPKQHNFPPLPYIEFKGKLRKMNEIN